MPDWTPPAPTRPPGCAANGTPCSPSPSPTLTRWSGCTTRSTLGDHGFLALEHIDGQPLNRVLVQRYRLTDADATDADRARYTAWALDIHAHKA
jgi:hypothetical protein